MCVGGYADTTKLRASAPETYLPCGKCEYNQGSKEVGKKPCGIPTCVRALDEMVEGRMN